LIFNDVAKKKIKLRELKMQKKSCTEVQLFFNNEAEDYLTIILRVVRSPLAITE